MRGDRHIISRCCWCVRRKHRRDSASHSCRKETNNVPVHPRPMIPYSSCFPTSALPQAASYFQDSYTVCEPRLPPPGWLPAEFTLPHLPIHLPPPQGDCLNFTHQTFYCLIKNVSEYVNEYCCILTSVLTAWQGIYLSLFIFVNIWTISIHDGDYRIPAPFMGLINGAIHHVDHHLFFNYNYGQYFTFWDRLGGSYRFPSALQGNGPHEHIRRLMGEDAKTQWRRILLFWLRLFLIHMQNKICILLWNHQYLF